MDGLGAAGDGAAGADVHHVHLQQPLSLIAVYLGLECHVHHLPLLELHAAGGDRKIDGVKELPSAAQTQTHMFAAPYHGYPVNGEAGQHQHGLGASGTGWLQNVQRVKFR